MTAESSKPTESVLRYATGERIEVGDVVSQPVNAGEEYGVVEEVLQPGEPTSRLLGGPDGAITVAWSESGSWFIRNEIILGEDYIYFVRRK